MSIRAESRAIARLITRYVEAAVRYGAACDADLPPPIANRHARRIVAAGRELKKAGDEGRRALNSLLDHDNPWVRVWAANDVYVFNERRALAVLEEIKKLSGLVSIEADMSVYALRGETPPSPWKRDRPR